ncbi:hypothetical protein D3C73_1437540 [compost metagenome]
MIAAGQDDAGPCLGDAHEGVIKQFHHVQARQGAIVDIPCNQHDVNGLGFHQRHQLVHEVALGIKHANAVE